MDASRSLGNSKVLIGPITKITLHLCAVGDLTVEGILYALSDPVRLQIFAQLQGAECAQICSDFLVLNRQELPKSTLSQHFKILREAGLIRSARKGVEMHNVTRCAELKERFGPMIREIVAAYWPKSAAWKGAQRSADALLCRRFSR